MCLILVLTNFIVIHIYFYIYIWYILFYIYIKINIYYFYIDIKYVYLYITQKWTIATWSTHLITQNWLIPTLSVDTLKTTITTQKEIRMKEKHRLKKKCVCVCVDASGVSHHHCKVIAAFQCFVAHSYSTIPRS